MGRSITKDTLSRLRQAKYRPKIYQEACGKESDDECISLFDQSFRRFVPPNGGPEDNHQDNENCQSKALDGEAGQ